MNNFIEFQRKMYLFLPTKRIDNETQRTLKALQKLLSRKTPRPWQISPPSATEIISEAVASTRL